MKYRQFFTPLALSILYFTCAAMSCKQTCPGYDQQAMARWLPYREGQEVVFTDGAGGRDVLHINKVAGSLSTEYKRNEDIVCASNAEISSGEFSSTSNPDLRFVHKRSDDGSGNVFLALHRFNVFAQDLRDSGIVADPGHAELRYSRYQQFTLGARTYPQVQCITTTDTGNALSGKPYRLYLAPDYGIVGYELFPSHKTWTLQ